MPGATAEARRQALVTFPVLDEIGAYGLATSEGLEALRFRTGRQVNQTRVGKALQGWQPDAPIEWVDRVEPIPPIDHRQGIAALQEVLRELPVAIEVRIGLTLQALQRDLARLRPELVLLYCHGIREGSLLFEDGRGAAEYVSGARLFGPFNPKPRVLVLNACYSGTVLARAKDRADWPDAAIVSIEPATPLEVGAGTAFQTMFYQGLLGGEPAGAAFEAAQRYVANDVHFGDLSVPADETPPSRKFRLYPGGESVALVPSPPAAGASEVRPETPHVRRIRRSSDRFVGRREELATALDALLPLPPGVRRVGPRRMVTLTKEGGIGKTAMAGELADWCVEREVFPGGVYELACETYASAEALLSRLLEVSGVSLPAKREDLIGLLRGWFSRCFPAERPALLVLDNLDDLFARASPARIEAGRLIEAALESAPSLRVLATCRWPLGLAEHELAIEVPPLRADEARDVFIENLVKPAHQSQVRATWSRPDTAARELIDKLSGRHPHALVLLARQMGRRGMTLGRLRDEARANLLKVLADPLAADGEQDRMEKAEVSYGLSYRHLSEPAKRLFERLSRFPDGVWCGEPTPWDAPWDALLGQGWRELIEKELDHYALLHWEPDPGDGTSGRYVMLPSLLEFARRQYRDADHAEWEPGWMRGWLKTVQTWNVLLSGRAPGDLSGTSEERAAFGRRARELAARLFKATQANWLAAFDHACEHSSAETGPWLAMTGFLRLSRQATLRRGLAEQAVLVQRARCVEEDLAPCLGTLGSALSDLGERESARKAFEESLEIRRRLAAADPMAYEPDVAMTLNNLGNVLGALGERDAARKACEEALEIRRRFAAVHPAAYEPDVAATLNNLGNVLGALGERDAARKACEEALEIRRRLAAAHPVAYEPDVAATLNNLGNVLGVLGERDAARKACEEALEIRRRLAAADPIAYEPDVAMTLNNLGNVLGALGERDAARKACEEALEIRRRLAAADPIAYEPDVAMTLNSLGNVLGALGDRESARAAYEEALEIRRRLTTAHPAAYEPDVAMTLNNLGSLLTELGERVAARAAYEEALIIYWPLAQQLPQAFAHDFMIALRNYVRVTEESEDDRWWRMWRAFEAGAGEGGQEA